MFFFADPPVVISPPHFYLGNESLVKAVTGLHPDKKLHQTFVDIEPVRRDILCSWSSVVLLGYWGEGARTTQRSGMDDVERRIGWLQSDGKGNKKKEED